jgi:hypothetical protein
MRSTLTGVNWPFSLHEIGDYVAPNLHAVLMVIEGLV